MVQVKLVNGLAPEYVGYVNPVLTLSPSEQSYTLYLQSKAGDKVEELDLAGRKLALQRLGRTCRGSSFKEFDLGAEFSVQDALDFAQGFYDPNFFKRDEKSFKVDASIEADFNLVHEHFLYLRDVVNLPADKVYPEELARLATERLQASAASVGKADALTVTKVGFEQLLEQGLVGIHTVGRGSQLKPCYLEVDFNPSGKADEPVVVALVGKGITFDTGGYSLKPSDSMSTMRSDMGGAGLTSAVLALAIAQGLNKRVKLFLSCAENMVSSNAFRLGDIIEYPNGVTASVDNTDAEGRLVLADSLIRASKSNNGERPAVIIDAATLTGAAKFAVGTDYHSLLSMDDKLVAEVEASAAEFAELFWRLPFAEFHRRHILSPVATISNTGAMVQSAGASTATAFLSYFVDDYQHGWLHIDASATFNRRGGAELAVGATGRGLQTLAHYLVNKA